MRTMPACRQWQAVSIASLRRRFGTADIYFVREFDAPVTGVKALQRFTRELWQRA